MIHTARQIKNKNLNKRIMCIAMTCAAVVAMTTLVSCGGDKPDETETEKTSETTEMAPTDSIADTSAEEISEESVTTYAVEAYGKLESLREEFTDEKTGELTYYYEMENFYVNDSFENADKINDTLQKIYDTYELSYRENAEAASGGFDTPYDSWHLLNLALVGEDYVSMEYNNISYMGGAHPYSYFDGITIDCRTGQEITAMELFGKSSDEILQQVSDEMEMDTVASWDEVDFYLTDSTIVFFYRMPNYWEDVVWKWTSDTVGENGQRLQIGDLNEDGQTDYVIYAGEDGYYNRLLLYLSGEGIVFEHEDTCFVETGALVCNVDIDHDGEKEILLTMLPHVNSMPLMEYAVLKKENGAWKKLEVYHAEEDILQNSFPLVIVRGKSKFDAELSCKGFDKVISFDLEAYYDYWTKLSEQEDNSFAVTNKQYYENEIAKAKSGEQIGNISAWGIWNIQLSDLDDQPCLVATQGIEGYDKADLWGQVFIYFDYDKDGRIRVLDLGFLPETRIE